MKYVRLYVLQLNLPENVNEIVLVVIADSKIFFK